MLRLIGETHIDFQGRRHFWMAVSGLLIVAGLVALVIKGGPNYSIDFTGGIAVVLRSYAPEGKPPVSEHDVRRSLEKVGVLGAEVKTSRSAEGEDLLVRMKVEGRFRPPEALIRNRLDETLGRRWQMVPDEQLAEDARRELTGFSYVAVQTDAAQPELEALLRTVEVDSPLVKEVRTMSSETAYILAGVGRDPVSRWRKQMAFDYPDYRFELRSIDMVGPRIGAELRWKALLALLFSWLLIILYLWYRFDLVFGVAAVLALIHDVLITFGAITFFNYELSMTVLGALLTLIGFSVNDTIVTFDRIRENLRRYRDWNVRDIVNASINQTLSRTIITSGTVFLVVLVLVINGGEVLRGFAVTMLVGIIVGTYSSIYIASPILVDYVERTGRPLRVKGKAK